MRKLRKAALVAAMAGSISVFGAGVASAHGADGRETGQPGNVTACNQQAEVTQVTFQNGLINGPLLGSGPATATSSQQICSGRDSLGVNGASARTGGGLLSDLAPTVSSILPGVL
ncbi:hypothetical protein ACFWUZ_35500 [Streptomyces sp. NPDC058646]|uniref:hypothetical protein n=1 Tax=Streptomyces sp. NPDC058646 TaxID=3346574 RepID=UPI003653F497